jgi:thiamine pyrophosphokinase
MFDILIVANGSIPPIDAWRDVTYGLLICTDGAANAMQHFGITPNIIIGDFDSLPNATECFPESQIEHITSQDTTDFEKALQYCMKFPNKRILCLGALGELADHSIYNLSLLLRYANQLDLCFLNLTREGRQWIFALKDKTRIYTPINSPISFFPFGEAVLTAPTLEWPLSRTHIKSLRNVAVRNRTTAQMTDIECEGDCLCFVGSSTNPISN